MAERFEDRVDVVDEAGRLVPGLEPEPTSALARWLDRHSRLYVWQKAAFRRFSIAGGLAPRRA